MKKIFVICIILMVSLFCGCGVMDIFEISDEIGHEVPATEEQDLPAETLSATGESAEAESTDITQDMERLYIGEYLDDNGDPNLEIAKGEDSKFIVQIGIFRLCSLDDGLGELTEEGMVFTATDPAGNPISGVITVEDETAKVTFTDSTWTYLENGITYEYTKSSETPNIWGE